MIFLTMSRITDVSQRGIYTDLMRRFRDEGHSVYIVTPRERSLGRPTELVEIDGIHVLGVKTLNLQKTNAIEKGLGQILLENQYKRGIQYNLKGVKFDLILYSTPPITFPKVIEFLKKENNEAKTYLLLKDIFPQNAVDMGMMKKNGLEGLLYKFFRKKEKKLYGLSDYIGCMSPANVGYIRKHNPDVSPEKVEVAPNSIEYRDKKQTGETILEQKIHIRSKYKVPLNKTVFIYGGNIGIPQGIPFLIDCLSANASREDCYFIVVGTGTELPKLKEWYEKVAPRSVKVMDGLPRDAYDELIEACDVGLIFLDHKFTIPNYPSRLLSYLEHKMPVLCATDTNTDIGRIAEENGFGYWCESNSVEAFTAVLDRIIHANFRKMGEKGYEFLKNNYLTQHTYSVIMKHLQ